MNIAAFMKTEWQGIRAIDRYWQKVDVRAPHECWEWSASLGTGGYGQFGIHGKPIGAHRISWILSHGQIPADTCVCHFCDNRLCVNPAHLFLGSRADNARDMHAKNRSRYKAHLGEKNGSSKLSKRDVLSIREMRESTTLSQKEIAARFGIKQPQVSAILLRRSWGHL